MSKLASEKTQESDDIHDSCTAAIGTLENMKKKRKHTDMIYNQEIFPLKLFQLLNEEKQENIIKWMGDGEYFKVFDKKRFLTEITPKYFRRKLIVCYKVCRS